MSVEATAAPVQRTGTAATLWARALPLRDFAAIPLAGGGALLIFLSFVYDWGTFHPAGGGDGLDVGVDTIPTWGTVYVLSAMLLVALFVAVMVVPPGFGRAARVLGIAWTFGVGGVVAAIVVRGASALAPFGTVLGGPDTADSTLAWGTGCYCSMVALVLLLAAFATAWPPLRGIEADRPADGR